MVCSSAFMICRQGISRSIAFLSCLVILARLDGSFLSSSSEESEETGSLLISAASVLKVLHGSGTGSSGRPSQEAGMGVIWKLSSKKRSVIHTAYGGLLLWISLAVVQVKVELVVNRVMSSSLLSSIAVVLGCCIVLSCCVTACCCVSPV